MAILMNLGIINHAKAQLSSINSAALDSIYITSLFSSPDTVFNLHVYGHFKAASIVQATNTNLGIDHGLLISTGCANTAFSNGPQGPNNETITNSGSPIGSVDTIADSIMSLYFPFMDLYDPIVIEFEMIPSVDTLELNMVFASEEYLEYIGSQFVDAFGIFVSKANAPLSFFNHARLPDNNIISTQNIHPTHNGFPAINESYFVDNTNGLTHEFDGFTIPINIKIPVTIGDTAHLTICLSDVADFIGDTGVFFERNPSSFLEVHKQSDIKFEFYPNPASSKININSALNSACKLEIFTFRGTLCRILEITPGSNLVDLENLEHGIYLFKVTNDKNVYPYRINIF